MKRDEAIAPLSREHHSTLILAQLLKKDAPVYNGLPTTDADKAVYAQEQFTNLIQKHFKQEEIMLDMAIGIHPDIDNLTTEIKDEHRLITTLFTALKNEDGLQQTMDTLATTLQDHIRKEERVLFPLLQQHCSEELLQEFYELLH